MNYKISQCVARTVTHSGHRFQAKAMKAADENIVGFGAGESACMKEISETVAQVRNCSLEELSAATCRTAQEFFRKLV